MQWSVVDLSHVKGCFTFRWDSEFYHPKTLGYQKLLESKNPSYLLNAIIIHPTEFQREYSEIGKKLLLSSNIGVNFLDDESAPLIEPEKASKLGLDEIKNGDVLVVRTGAVGHAASFRSTTEKAYASCDTIIIRNTQFLCGYLSSFFHSKYGKKLLERGKYGLAQPHILPSYLRTIPIPTFSKGLEINIDNLIENSYWSLSQSKKYLQNAESLLLTELGLENWQPKKQLSFVANYAEVEDANRFDADYFQPHYKELLKRIRSGNSMPLSEIANHYKGIEVGTEAYQSDGIPFIRVSDVSENGFEKTEKHISTELYQQLKADHAPKKGDVLFTKDGTIGRSFVVQDDKEAILSGAFLKLTIKPSVNVEPDYLALVLNSIICKTQIERLSGGAIIAHLKPSDAMAMTIPVLDDDIQTEICSLIAQSRQERDASKHLLETAKRAVEIAIEEDEAAAFHFLEMEAK